MKNTDLWYGTDAESGRYLVTLRRIQHPRSLSLLWTYYFDSCLSPKIKTI
jgi:hypothetical protein